MNLRFAVLTASKSSAQVKRVKCHFSPPIVSQVIIKHPLCVLSIPLHDYGETYNRGEAANIQRNIFDSACSFSIDGLVRGRLIHSIVLRNGEGAMPSVLNHEPGTQLRAWHQGSAQYMQRQQPSYPAGLNLAELWSVPLPCHTSFLPSTSLADLHVPTEVPIAATDAVCRHQDARSTWRTLPVIQAGAVRNSGCSLSQPRPILCELLAGISYTRICE